MALLSDIKETVVLYQGAYSTVKYGKHQSFMEFGIDKALSIEFEYTKGERTFLTVEHSTDDMRWILNKLYNE